MIWGWTYRAIRKLNVCPEETKGKIDSFEDSQHGLTG